MITARELLDTLKQIAQENPDQMELPVHMYSDAEGNDCHALQDVGLDVDDLQEGSPVVAIVLVPEHGSVEGWW